MNFAFPALLIVLLILPGILFRYSYARGWWGDTSPTSFRAVSEDLAYSAVFAVGLHFVGLAIASCFGYEANFRALLALLAGNFGPGGEEYERTFASVAAHPIAITAYFTSLSVSAAAGGLLAHSLVRVLGLDRRFRLLRFRNEWHYILTGEVTTFPDNSLWPHDPAAEVDVFLSAVVSHGKDSYLYWGLLSGWSLDSRGELDALHLRFAHRRLLEQDKSAGEGGNTLARVFSSGRYYEINGDLLVLRYSEITTVNLEYFSLIEDEADDPLEPGEDRILAPGQGQ